MLSERQSTTVGWKRSSPILGNSAILHTFYPRQVISKSPNWAANHNIGNIDLDLYVNIDQTCRQECGMCGTTPKSAKRSSSSFKNVEYPDSVLLYMYSPKIVMWSLFITNSDRTTLIKQSDVHALCIDFMFKAPDNTQILIRKLKHVAPQICVVGIPL